MSGSPGLHVHSTHTEIEGGRAMHPLFARQLAAWKGDGVRFVTLGEAAAEVKAEVKAEGKAVPARPLGWATLPGRATPVAVGVAPGLSGAARPTSCDAPPGATQ